MKHSPRPLVIVEDHTSHIDTILELLQPEPELLSRLTVVCLATPGHDTDSAVERWTGSFPDLRVVASVVPTNPRQEALPAEVLADPLEYETMVRERLAPRGVLLHDIQLDTLAFLPTNESWKTIKLAAGVRGMSAGTEQPRCLFMSNKSTFPATFGKELEAHGFEQLDVLNKDKLGETLVPLLHRLLHEAFPLELERSNPARRQWLTADGKDIERLDEQLDVLLWEHRAAQVTLSGAKVVATAKGHVLASHTYESVVWRELVDAHLRRGPGVSSEELADHVAAEHSAEPTKTDAGTRLIHKMRGRLENKKKDLPIVDHYYRLASELRVGRVRRRPRSPGSRGNTSSN